VWKGRGGEGGTRLGVIGNSIRSVASRSPQKHTPLPPGDTLRVYVLIQNHASRTSPFVPLEAGHLSAQTVEHIDHYVPDIERTRDAPQWDRQTRTHQGNISCGHCCQGSNHGQSAECHSHSLSVYSALQLAGALSTALVSSHNLEWSVPSATHE
jgi:hypothetical protein